MKKEHPTTQEIENNKFDILNAAPDVMSLGQFFECWGDIGQKLLELVWPNRTEKPNHKP